MNNNATYYNQLITTDWKPKQIEYIAKIQITGNKTTYK